MATLLAAACSSERAAENKAVVYVAVGDSLTFGTGLADPAKEAWPVLFRQADLPADAQMTNLGVPGSTVADALRQQADKAVDAEPTLVTVWLGANDLFHLVPVATYESQLRDLVHRMRRGGATKVLVANLPAYERLSFFPVDAYNAAVARVADKEGAVLVDIHAQRVDPSYVGPDGLHPSVAGHRAIAAVFGAANR